MSIIIESGIPLPPVFRPTARAAKYPELRGMNIGDSFLVVTENNEKARTSARVQWAHTAKRVGIHIATRVVNNGAGIRVWRVEAPVAKPAPAAPAVEAVADADQA